MKNSCNNYWSIKFIITSYCTFLLLNNGCLMGAQQIDQRARHPQIYCWGCSSTRTPVESETLVIKYPSFWMFGTEISIILDVWERNKFHDLPMWTTINLRLLYNQVFSTIVAWTKWLSARTTNRYLTWPWRSSEARKGLGGLRFRGGSLHWFWSYFPTILGSCNSNSFIYGKLEHVRPLNMLKELFTSAE